MSYELQCPGYGSAMVLRTTRTRMDRSGRPAQFYGCLQYPHCTETVPADSAGRPLGAGADRETRAMRRAAFMALDAAFGKPNRPRARQERNWWLRHRHQPGEQPKPFEIRGMSRGEALEVITDVVHLGFLPSAQADAIIEQCLAGA